MMTDTSILLHRGLLLEYITLGWNVVGTAIVIAAAIAAHSVALAGFGLDSLVEIGASVVVVWHLRGIHKGRERAALRSISIAFFALAIYIAALSAHTLWLSFHPSTSQYGMAWLALTFVVMGSSKNSPCAVKYRGLIRSESSHGRIGRANRILPRRSTVAGAGFAG